MSAVRAALVALRRRELRGEPCWCGKPQGHIGWLMCLDAYMEREAS